MAEIMDVAKERQLKTRIMYRVNLSFSQVNEYLAFLTEMGFLRIILDNKKKGYETTEKGNRYIENYLEMVRLLKSQEQEIATIVRWVNVEVINKENYNIFSALVETIHNKEMKKLRFAKCKKCGRLTPFRLNSTRFVTVQCKKCGNNVTITTIKQM